MYIVKKCDAFNLYFQYNLLFINNKYIIIILYKYYKYESKIYYQSNYTILLHLVLYLYLNSYTNYIK